MLQDSSCGETVAVSPDCNVRAYPEPCAQRFKFLSVVLVESTQNSRRRNYKQLIHNSLAEVNAGSCVHTILHLIKSRVRSGSQNHIFQDYGHLNDAELSVGIICGKLQKSILSPNDTTVISLKPLLPLQ